MIVVATMVYYLFLITMSPYSKSVVQGPFENWSACNAVAVQLTAPTGARYECDMVWQP